VSGKKVATPEF